MSLLRLNGMHAIWCSHWVTSKKAVRGTTSSSPQSLFPSAFKPQLTVFSGQAKLQKHIFTPPHTYLKVYPQPLPRPRGMRRDTPKQALCTSKQKLGPTACPFKHTIKMPVCTLLFP